MEKLQFRTKVLPFSLTLFLIALDQITKAIIVATVPVGTVGKRLLGDYLYIVHQENLGMAFSLFDNLTPLLRTLVLIALPSFLIIFSLIYFFRGTTLTTFQRWLLCGIVGGGVGNLIDRITRPTGVVDFISLKFWGIFGMERWPTFNVADASVLTCVILFGITTIFFDSSRTRDA